MASACLAFHSGLLIDFGLKHSGGVVGFPSDGTSRHKAAGLSEGEMADRNGWDNRYLVYDSLF